MNELRRGYWIWCLPLAMIALLAGYGCSRGVRQGEPLTPRATPSSPDLVSERPPADRPEGEGPNSPEPLAVYFDFDQARLREDAREVLKQHGRRLVSDRASTWSIEGHCDERGTVEYNLALGERRARAVRDFLVAFGVDGSRLDTVSFGEERPIDPGHDEEAWLQNRRADLRHR